MNEQEFSIALEDILNEDVMDVRSVSSFEDALVLTSDEGIVVRLSTGEEFQITIVQSKQLVGEKGAA